MKTLNILIPIDFTPVSEQALLMGDLLSNHFILNIHLLYVIEANESIISGDPNLAEDVNVPGFEKRKQDAQANFSKLQEAGRVFESHVKIGLLTDQIKLASEAFEADLVIMGTKGSSGFIEKISGSEAQQVVRHLHMPVLTLKAGTTIHELKNLLFVTDFEYFGSGKQINLLKNLATAFGSTIHLLHILKKSDHNKIDLIKAQMEFFAEEHGFEHYEMHLYQDQKVADGVYNFNQEAEMDLVCIRTHGRTGLSHLLFGSIAERLVNHCQKPLLTFRLN